MTVSFTQKEVEWLYDCLTVATQDVDEELDFANELIDTVKRIKKKTYNCSSERNIETKKRVDLSSTPLCVS